MNLKEIKETAIEAAYVGADVISGYIGKIHKIDKKGASNIVTEADWQSEAAILKIIRDKYPHHSITAEESGESNKDPACQWYIDPLDGTTNFAHGFDIFSVSLAFLYNGKPVVGVVLNPTKNELFTGIYNEGSQLNGKSIRVSSVKTVSNSLLVTGFPYSIRENINSVIKRLQNCLHIAQDIRSLGSAALDLCYVACGRFEGFWEQYLSPWDTAAGTLIAREAGATLTDFYGNQYSIEMPEILATNGHIHAELMRELSH